MSCCPASPPRSRSITHAPTTWAASQLTDEHIQCPTIRLLRRLEDQPVDAEHVGLDGRRVGALDLDRELVVAFAQVVNAQVDRRVGGT